MINSDTGPQSLPPPKRPRRLWWILASVAAVLGAGAGVAAMQEVPYRTMSPGDVWTMDGSITVEGAETFESQGEMAFTTVSISNRRLSRLEAFFAGLDPAVEVLSEPEIFGSDTPEQNRERNQAFMADSKTLATAVALEALGYEVARPMGARVMGVDQDLPAADILEAGDLIVAVDGQSVTTWEQVVEIIGAKAPGDRLELDIERLGDHDADSADDPDIEALTVSATLARADEPDEQGRPRPILGVFGETALELDFPFEVDIDSGRVAGPSAGLAFTLALLDALTPEDLTGGVAVATTGTIMLNGDVGPVGGTAQKTIAARRAGMELFLVPESEVAKALPVAGDLEVVGVANLADALAALETVGGDTRALQAELSARLG